MTEIKTCIDCEKPVEADSRVCHNCGADLDVSARQTNVWLNLQQRLSRAAGDKYEVKQLIGYGGMAGVYLARDLKLNRHVALKLISPAVVMDPKMVRRFRQEAQTMAQLDHPNIVPIHDIRERDDLLFIEMKYVPGRTLAETVTDTGEPLPSDIVATWLAQVSAALAHAHTRETPVIHRDIKPSNIILNERGDAQLTDFGIAKIQGNSDLTRTGHLIGTPAYMSPEQCDGESLTSASDQYSLGTVAYELLAGVPPFRGPTLMVLQAHSGRDAAPLLDKRADCPPKLAEIIDRMLAKNPSDRWSSMAEVGAEFARALSTPVPRSTLVSWSKHVHQLSIPTRPERLSLGTSERLVAKTLDGKGSEIQGRRVSWSSTNERVAFVSPHGVVAGLGVGSALIVAKSGRAVSTLEVEVLPPPADRLEVTPEWLEIGVGDSQRVSVESYDDAGQLIDAAPTFTVDRAGVVQIGADGEITARAAGNTELTVEAGGLIKVVPIRVTSKTGVGAIQLPVEGLELAPGKTHQLAPRVSGPDGAWLANPEIEWWSSNRAVAAVSPDGLVRAISPGIAELTAESGPLSATVTVTVGTPSATGAFPAVAPARPARTHAVADVAKEAAPEVDDPFVPAGTSRMGRPAQPRPARSVPPRRRIGPVLLGKPALIGGGALAGLIVLFGLVQLLGRGGQQPQILASILPGDTTVVAGTQVQFRLGAGSASLADVDASWSSSDLSVATIATSGLMQARAPGTVLISASGGGLAPIEPLVVNVVAGEAPGRITILGPQELSTTSAPLTYRLQDADGAVVDNTRVQWTLEPANLATVNSAGAVNGRSAGRVTLTANLDGQTTTHELQIVQGQAAALPAFRDIQVGSIPEQVVVGSTIEVSAWLRDQNFQRQEGPDLAWTSSNERVLQGSGTSGFTAVALGRATLTVASAAANLRRSLPITVIADRAVSTPPPVTPSEEVVESPGPAEVTPAPTAVSIQSGAAELSVGEAQTLSAAVLDAAGSALANHQVAWSSSNPNVAAVTSIGRVTAAASGSTWILASYQTMRDSVSVTVRSEVPSGTELTEMVQVYLGLLRSGSGPQVRALVPPAALEANSDFLEFVSDGRLQTQGQMRDLQFEDGEARFSITMTRRTPFGSTNEAQVQFIAEIAPVEGRWQMISCAPAPGSELP